MERGILQKPQRRSVTDDSLAYEPLSDRPKTDAKDTSFVDKLELVKESPKTADEVKQSKDVTLVIVETENILKFGLKKSKQQQQIQNELKALLEHEQKIIQQIFERAKKFKEFKDETKKESDDFENEHILRIPFYAQYLKQLAELPETQNITQEGIPKAVQAKILYNIVENTTNVANNTIVLLSIEKTLMNDIDSSMQKLLNFAIFIMTNYQIWNKTLATQETTLNQIITTYNKLNEDVNKIKETKIKPVPSLANPQDAEAFIRSVEERLGALENQIKEVKDKDICCDERSPSSHPPKRQGSRRALNEECCGQPSPLKTLPPCPPCVRSTESLSPGRVHFSPTEEVARDQYTSRLISPPFAGCPQDNFTPDSFELPKKQTAISANYDDKMGRLKVESLCSPPGQRN